MPQVLFSSSHIAQGQPLFKGSIYETQHELVKSSVKIMALIIMLPHGTETSLLVVAATEQCIHGTFNPFLPTNCLPSMSQEMPRQFSWYMDDNLFSFLYAHSVVISLLKC